MAPSAASSVPRGSCSLYRAHIQHWNPKDRVLTSVPFRIAEIYQTDRFVYIFDITQLEDEELRGYPDWQ